MTKSLKKILREVLIVLVVLIATNGLQAFALDTNYERGGAETPYNLEQVVITKYLETTLDDAILTGYSSSTWSSPSTGASQKRWYKSDTSYSIYASWVHLY